MSSLATKSKRVNGGDFNSYEELDLYPEMLRRIKLGWNDQEVARAVGVSSRTVLRYRQRNDIPANK